jgi:hypothetical protein
MEKTFNPFEKKLTEEFFIGIRTQIKVYDIELQKIEEQFGRGKPGEERAKRIKEIVNLKSKLKADRYGLRLFELIDSLDALLCSNY